MKVTAAGRRLEEASLTRAQMLVGLKGYVTNIPVGTLTAEAVVSSYHDLWHVEQSFRMGGVKGWKQRCGVGGVGRLLVG